MANNIGFNPNKFVKESDECKNHSIQEVVVIEEKSPTTKKKRSAKKEMITPANQTTEVSSPINFLQTDISYMEAYRDTNNQLDKSIMQLDTLGNELFNELTAIKASKTLKNKYNYLNDMTSTMSNIISTKITAIKEKNKTINDVNNLELRRMKELKIDASAEDDNTRIMNLYDAFVNTPIGTSYGPNILGPSMSELTLSGGAPDLGRIQMGSDQQQWESSLDPAQNRMVLEAKGVIDTVVFYDESTGNRWYEVVDKQTGQPIPNVEKPDNTFIYELDINTTGGYAKDSNRNVTYPLIIVNGGDNSILDY